MSEIKKPERIEKHQVDYKEGAWRSYSLQELGWWVHLFAKRASHRDNEEKKAKDLYDAQNYLDMMQATINAIKED